MYVKMRLNRFHACFHESILSWNLYCGVISCIILPMILPDHGDDSDVESMVESEKKVHEKVSLIHALINGLILKTTFLRKVRIFPKNVVSSI